MDFVDLVREARNGDVSAFVALTRRFQHLAFGSALALVRDFQVAEDVTQDAFPAALFYVHDCSHQDIATFLSLSVTTVNNRLHAARVDAALLCFRALYATTRNTRLADRGASRVPRDHSGPA
jgi:DNA-directed RNA polymerase specialized sigma24 family protein